MKNITIMLLTGMLFACTENPQTVWAPPHNKEGQTTSLTQIRVIKNRQSIPAECIIQMQDIKGYFQAPAYVKLPTSIEGQLPQVIISCEAGSNTRTEILLPQNDQNYQHIHAQNLSNDLEISNIVGSTQYSNAQATPSSLASIAFSTNVVSVNQQYYPSRLDINFD